MTLDKSIFIDESKINNDYKNLESLVQEMSQENQSLGKEIIDLVSKVHKHISSKTQQEEYQLLKLIKGNTKSEGYTQINKFLEKFGLTNDLKLKLLIEQSILTNKKISSEDKQILKTWFSEQFNSDDFKDSISKKIDSDVTIEIQPIKNTKELQDVSNNFVSNILTHKSVLGNITSRILKVTKEFNKINYDTIVKTSLAAFKNKNIERIKQIKFQEKQLLKINDIVSKTKDNLQNNIKEKQQLKINDTINKSKEILQNKFQEKSKIQFINKYNKYVIGEFKKNIKDINSPSVEALADKLSKKNILHNFKNKFKNLKSIIKNPKKKLHDNLKKLSSADFWKKKFKSGGMTTLKIINGIINGGISLAISGVKIAGGSIIALMKLPFTLTKFGFSLIKNILKLSFRIVKSTIKNGMSFLNRIRLFLFSPIGAYITGFVIGFLWGKIKQIGGFIWKKIKWFEEHLKEYFNNLDKELQEKSPTYKAIRDKINRMYDIVMAEYDIFKKKFSEYDQDIKDIIGENDEKKRKEKIEQLKNKIRKDVRFEKILDFSADSLKKAIVLIKKINDYNKDGRLTQLIDGFQRLMTLRAVKSAAGSAANSMITSAGTMAGTVIGSFLAPPPLGQIIGGTVGGALGKMIGIFVENAINKIPEVQLKGKRAKLAARMKSKYFSKKTNKNLDDIEDSLIQKYDKKNNTNVKRKLQDYEWRINRAMDEKDYAEVERLTKLKDDLEVKVGLRGVRELYNRDDAVDFSEKIEQFLPESEDQDKLDKYYYESTAEQIVKFLTSESSIGDLKSIDVSKLSKLNPRRWAYMNKKYNADKLVRKLFDSYIERKISKDTFIKYLKQGLQEIDNIKMSLNNEWGTIKEWMNVPDDINHRLTEGKINYETQGYDFTVKSYTSQAINIVNKELKNKNIDSQIRGDIVKLVSYMLQDNNGILTEENRNVLKNFIDNSITVEQKKEERGSVLDNFTSSIGSFMVEHLHDIGGENYQEKVYQMGKELRAMGVKVQPKVRDCQIKAIEEEKNKQELYNELATMTKDFADMIEEDKNTVIVQKKEEKQEENNASDNDTSKIEDLFKGM